MHKKVTKNLFIISTVNDNWLLGGHHFFIKRRPEASNTNCRGGDAMQFIKLFVLKLNCWGIVEHNRKKYYLFFYLSFLLLKKLS
jgi:hypothetical protein